MTTLAPERPDDLAMAWRLGEYGDGDRPDSPAGPLFPEGRFTATEITATGDTSFCTSVGGTFTCWDTLTCCTGGC